MKPIIAAFEQKKSFKRPPVWFMRQAGRYMEEYLAIRKNFDNFLEFCLTPKIAAEATMQPIKAFGFDAAIIFSDILTIPFAMGIDVVFEKNHGPKLEKISSKQEISKLKNIDKNVFEKVKTAVQLVKTELSKNYPDTALIGFVGAPWTLSCYMIEGMGSKTFEATRKFAYQNEYEFEMLIEILTNACIDCLEFQIEGGAEVVQIFDSWSSLAVLDEFDKWVISPTRKIVNHIKKKYPHIKIIGFPKGAGILYKKYAINTLVDGISIDQNIPIEWAVEELSDIALIQGNLDNVLLASNLKKSTAQTKYILEQTINSRFIFNLGHGILPSTPRENVHEVLKIIKGF